MKERRWPWFVSGALLVAAGLGAGAATYLWWLPCRGQMLVGTPLGPAFQDLLLTRACTDRMNEGTPFPLATTAALATPGLLLLSTLTMILVAVAWLVPVASLAVATETRVLIALPGLALLGVTLLGVPLAYGLESVSALGYFLDALLNVFALVGLGLVLAARVVGRVRFAILTLAVSAFGFFGMVADYVLMVHWSDASWDSPPGSGYLTAALLVACGIAVLIISAFARRSHVILADAGALSEQMEAPA